MKPEILAILKENRDCFVSGQAISLQFGITRAAVWKYIKQLQSEGYGIQSVPKNGYRLQSCPDILTGDEINEYLTTSRIGRKILHFHSIDSTNNKARELAELGEPEGTVVIAEEQTQGKGKLGRAWHSQAHKGIWMSMILRPDADLSAASFLMQLACVAVGKAAGSLAETIWLKWPNDILLNGKKICGILTQSSGEIDKAEYVIIGIGINVNQDQADFPDPLRARATSLKIETGKPIVRQTLIAKILNEFEKNYLDSKNPEAISRIMEFCRQHSSVIGKPVLLERHGQQVRAQAVDINDQGQLCLRLDNGAMESVGSGDVFVLE